MDNRRFSRVLISGPAALSVGDETFPGVLKDLSLKGALLVLDAPAQLLITKPYLLEMSLNDGALALSMQVSIVYQNGLHIGVRIEKIDIDSASHLRRLLELNLGDAALLERELSELTLK